MHRVFLNVEDQAVLHKATISGSGRLAVTIQYHHRSSNAGSARTVPAAQACPGLASGRTYVWQANHNRPRELSRHMPGCHHLICLVPKAGRMWTVPPTRERKGPNPKPEIRGPKEGRNPKSEMPERGFGLRYSAFFRVSALGFRIWAAGGRWYFPDTPPKAHSFSTSLFMAPSCRSMDSTSLNCVRQRSRLWLSRCTLK